MTPEGLVEAGVVAARQAVKHWQARIVDYPYTESTEDDSPDELRCKNLIDGFVRGKLGLDWSWKRPYRGDGDPAHAGGWCGAFWAACWAPAGLAYQIRRYNVASTIRLAAWGRGERRVRNGLIRPGDCLVVGRKRPQGDHITLAIGFPKDGTIEVIEGNGHGQGPDGKRFEGVVRNVRPLSDVVHAYRPLPEDLGPVVG